MTDPDQRKKREDGVRTLADIRSRCVISAETGCWLWSMATITPRGGVTPVVHLASGALGQAVHSSNMPAARAAWLLAGNAIPPGHVVWRHLCAGGLCINPAHCRAGTRTQMHAGVAATGRNRGRPERAVVNAINRLAMTTAVEVVREVEAMFAAGTLQKEIRERFGLAQKTAASIRLGQHTHSAGRQRLVRGASVFALGGAE